MDTVFKGHYWGQPWRCLFLFKQGMKKDDASSLRSQWGMGAVSEYECLDYIFVNKSLQFTALNNIGLPLILQIMYMKWYINTIFSLINPFALVYPVQDWHLVWDLEAPDVKVLLDAWSVSFTDVTCWCGPTTILKTSFKRIYGLVIIYKNRIIRYILFIQANSVHEHCYSLL